MVELINNQSKLLGDDLKAEIKQNSKVKVAASYFSIYAYDALKKELEGVKELEFVFTSPTFIKDKVSENNQKASREFYIPKQFRENSLYGSDFEIRLRNQLTQKAIARECADWIRNKVKFKSVTSSATMPKQHLYGII